MKDLLVHPAEMLAQQIDRVSGLIRTLGELYAPQSESFAAGNSFIAHGLIAAGTLLEETHGAIQRLHQIDDYQFGESATQPITQNEAPEDQPMVFPPIENEWQATNDQSEVDQTVIPVQATPVARDDEFARSYLELLRKLTAAEVFAAEQNALAAPGSGQNLLPLLRSLREEFQKLHRVA